MKHKKAVIFCFTAACIGYALYKWHKFWEEYSF